MSERGHKQCEDPLISRSALLQFTYVNMWSVSFQADRKKHSGVKAKHISAHGESCVLFWKVSSQIRSAFKKWLTENMKYWRSARRKRPIYSIFQRMLYIKMSHSHIMWCYYRQYIALWGIIWLLINVFDHVSHYCQHMWSSTWVMALSLYTGIKESSICCAP